MVISRYASFIIIITIITVPGMNRAFFTTEDQSRELSRFVVQNCLNHCADDVPSAFLLTLKL
jgi:hypothetical protein